MSEKLKIWIVNIITGSRILGTVLLPLIITSFDPLGVALYIAGLWCTDFIDGGLARHWEVSTIFGAVLDSFSDKLLQIATFLYLGSINPIMYLPLGLEATTMISNSIYGYKGADVKTSKYGKKKTIILGFTTALAALTTLSSNAILNIIVPLLVGTSVVTEVIALKDYISQNKKYLKEHPPKKRKHKKFKKWKELKEVLFSPNYHKEHINEPLLDKLAQDEIPTMITIEDENPESISTEGNMIFTQEEKNELLVTYNLNNNEIDRLEEFCNIHKITTAQLKNYLSLYINSLDINHNINLETFLCKEHKKTKNLQ